MNENRIISWPTFILSSLMIIIMGTIVIFIIGPRLVSSRELPRPTLQPTAHLSLFQPTNTSTPLPTATATPTSTATPTLTPSPTNTPIPPTAVPSQTLPPGVTPSPTLPPTPEPPTLRLVAGQPQSYLTQFRLVTYYGVPTGPQLGILGAAPRPTMLQQLQGLAAQYQALSLDHHVLPTYHIIVTIADPFPGDFNNYSHWLNNDVLKEWVNSAAESGVAVILDIQPGHAGISFEINRLREFLLLPHVHLALDPEFIMEDGEIPGQKIGHIDAGQINEAQEILNEIALETGLNKVLIIHQFEPQMVRNKDQIIDYTNVELVFDADGFGGPGAKIGDYNQYANELGFEYGGFKLFYGWDSPVLTPVEVMALDPSPSVIIYQ